MESGGLTASTDLERVLTRSTFSVNPGAGDSLKRENKRAFTVGGNYQTLNQMRDCAAPAGSNYQYPIVGTIGIAETIQTFLTMALHEELNGTLDATQPETDLSKSIAGSPTMVETLTFTTMINAGRCAVYIVDACHQGLAAGQRISEIAPGLKRAAIMFNPGTFAASAYMPPLETAARSLKVEPIHAPVHSDAEIDNAFINALRREPGGGLIVIADVFLAAHRAPIILAAARNNVPAVYPQSEFAREGACSPAQSIA